jgi:hypothetical protein
MTRKDYKIIADAVVEIHSELRNAHASLASQYIITRYLRQNYHNFDSTKFKEYIDKRTPELE